MVGRVRFTGLAEDWTANIIYMVLTVILSAVLMGMVLAKMNSNYTEVVRQGYLFYYQDLFNLRFLYKLD